MTSAVEKHAELVAAGWRSRVDGLWRPPPEWNDRRSFTASAAWQEHIRRQQAGTQPPATHYQT
jgi:hypothetical protein